MYLFCYLYNFVLLSLIILEFIILRLLLLMSIIIFKFIRIQFILYYLVFIVCESVYGLTLLILLIRDNGNRKINLLNLLLW